MQVLRLRDTERASVHAHLLKLPEIDRYMRFSRSMGDAALLHYVTGIDFSSAVCLGIRHPDGALIAYAEGFEYVARGRRRLEVAFTTAPEWRRQGLARSLFAAFGQIAERSAIDRLDVHCLARNLPMRGLLRSVSASAIVEDGEVTAEWVVARQEALQ